MTIRVLHLTTVATPIAGAELTSLLLARELPAHGIDFEVCTLSPRGQLHERLAAAGVDGSSLDARGPRQSLRGLVRLERRIRTFRPHVIHAHLFHAGILAAIASKRARVPFVLTRQYVKGVEWYRGAWAKHVDAWVARQASSVVAISTEVQSYLAETTKLPASTFRIVHNAADVDRYVDASRRDVEGKSDDGHVQLVYVASLHPRKGHVYLLEAMRLLKQRGKRCRLLLVGDGAERSKLEELVRENDIVDRVSFLGWRNDVDAVFADGQIYVHSALEEAFGIAIAEAMAAGLPVVATDVGGIPDVVDNGTTGFLVPSKHPEALAEKLALLVDDAAARKRMGDAGKERAFSLFSPKKLAETYADVFRDAAPAAPIARAS